MTVGELGEFGLIGRIARLPGVRGIGDDAAVLPRPRGGRLIATTDALVEGVHFRWTTQSPGLLGRRALAVNLSDLAAMGARPLGCLLALALPPRLDAKRALGLVRGLAALGGRHGCPLVGGNVTRARETSATVTAFGTVRRVLRRSGARPGDGIFVTGSLGGAALALAAGRSARAPEPRLDAGRALGRLGATGACIDVSDGLLADLRHVLEASGVGAEVDAGCLPTPPGFVRACRRRGLDPVALALEGGEDYELLFTVRRGGPGAAALARRLGVRVTRIGTITRRGLDLRGGRPTNGGWRHF